MKGVRIRGRGNEPKRKRNEMAFNRKNNNKNNNKNNTKLGLVGSVRKGLVKTSYGGIGGTSGGSGGIGGTSDGSGGIGGTSGGSG